MAPLPGALGGSELVAWRLDRERFGGSWDSGEGAYRHGGRWNSPGVRAVYAALDPATTIVEVAVHATFKILDTVPHVMTEIGIEPSGVHVVDPDAIPNPNWIRPSFPSPNQQAYGDALLEQHRFVVIPSSVSPGSWNLIFVAERARGDYAVRQQSRFALDPRLPPPVLRA
ncbi:RES family NAD+ phosphorylase [Mangrovicella endophytica]|uniref:RES family NAD+ phosphorylase n=1 Tax=Mangrovicella endophytica TaxID=2066697 RepID=UPI000C9E35DC|nr:RES domain-containing protein [Mangrovicella endophytica]